MLLPVTHRLGDSAFRFVWFVHFATDTLKDTLEFLLPQTFDPCCLNSMHFAFHSDIFSLKTKCNAMSSPSQISGADMDVGEG